MTTSSCSTSLNPSHQRHRNLPVYPLYFMAIFFIQAPSVQFGISLMNSCFQARNQQNLIDHFIPCFPLAPIVSIAEGNLFQKPLTHSFSQRRDHQSLLSSYRAGFLFFIQYFYLINFLFPQFLPNSIQARLD